MNTQTMEETAPAEMANKKARSAARRAHSASAKAKPGKESSPAKKAPKAKRKAEGAQEGSKAAKVLELLRMPEGVTLAELMKTTGWQAHSVRGFLSGTLRKKLGLTIESTKGEDGERTYSVKA